MKAHHMITILFVMLLTPTLKSQTVNQLHAWYTYSGNHTLSKDYQIHTLYSFRRSGIIENWQQSLLRLGLTRKISANLSALIGYDHAVTYPYGEYPIAENVTEHRTLERLIFNHNLTDNISASHRYTLEQRYVSGHDTKHRMRYRLTTKIPLKKIDDHKQLFISAFNEVFINLGSSSLPHLLDQNWYSLSLGYSLDKYSAITIGYMNQYLIKPDNMRIENNHTLLLGVSKNFDFSKKQ